MFKFGRGSYKILNTVNKWLILSAEATIAESKIDISIPEWGGYRTAEYQFKLFKKGWSRADGTQVKSKHQLKDEDNKSRALDLCAYFDGEQNWDKERLVYIATLMVSNFKRLKIEGKIPDNLHIHAGMFWQPNKSNLDGLGFDKPHFQVSSKPQVKIYV
jgi:hypothetical protein